MVGGDNLIASIVAGGAGAIDFDKCLATPDMAPKLGRIARVGPEPTHDPRLLSVADLRALLSWLCGMVHVVIEPVRLIQLEYSSNTQPVDTVPNRC